MMTLNAVAETSLFARNPDFNLGRTTLASGASRVGDLSRALFRFDLSSLPADAIITGASVQLSVTRVPDPDKEPGPASSDFSLHRVLVDWGEGTGEGLTGTAAKPGEATWSSRFHDTTSWSAPGALLGTDFANNPSATTNVNAVGSYFWNSQELVNDVNSWVADPVSNFGLILVSNNEGTRGTARRFSAKEDVDGGIPPQLIITFIPEPSSAILLAVAIAGATIRRNRGISLPAI